MDKNSLIQDIKNDLNSIKKQVEITLAKLAVLESMIELDNKLGISVQTSGEQSSLELSRVQPEITSGASNEELGVEKLEPVAEPAPEPVVVSVAELVEAPVAELGISNEELGIKESVQESRDNACIVREPEPIAVSVAEPVAESVAVSVAEPVEAPVEELGVRSEELGVEKLEPVAGPAPEPVAVSVAEPVEAPVAEAQVLRNLMSVISLGDKFRFRHDLFSDSNDLFKETIEILNTIEEFDEAVSYLQGKFNWDAEDATVVYFYDIIRPKF